MNNGKQGEQLFYQIMRGRNYTVEDVREIRKYQLRDTDFILTSPTTGTVKTFEVKWDEKLNSTGNIFIEMINPRSHNLDGWFEFIEADYLAYGDAISQKFYIINVEWLKSYFVEKKRRLFEYKKCNDGAEGYLVPLKLLIHTEL